MKCFVLVFFWLRLFRAVQLLFLSVAEHETFQFILCPAVARRAMREFILGLVALVVAFVFQPGQELFELVDVLAIAHTLSLNDFDDAHRFFLH